MRIALGILICLIICEIYAQPSFVTKISNPYDDWTGSLIEDSSL